MRTPRQFLSDFFEDHPLARVVTLIVITAGFAAYVGNQLLEYLTMNADYAAGDGIVIGRMAEHGRPDPFFSYYTVQYYVGGRLFSSETYCFDLFWIRWYGRHIPIMVSNRDPSRMMPYSGVFHISWILAVLGPMVYACIRVISLFHTTHGPQAKVSIAELIARDRSKGYPH